MTVTYPRRRSRKDPLMSRSNYMGRIVKDKEAELNAIERIKLKEQKAELETMKTMPRLSKSFQLKGKQLEEIKAYLKLKALRKRTRAPKGFYNLKRYRPKLILDLYIKVTQELRMENLLAVRDRAINDFRNDLIKRTEIKDRMSRRQLKKGRTAKNAKFPCLKDGKFLSHSYRSLGILRRCIGKLGGKVSQILNVYQNKNGKEYERVAQLEQHDLRALMKWIKDGDKSCKEILWELDSAIKMINRVKAYILDYHVINCLNKEKFSGTEEQRKEEALRVGLLIEEVDKWDEVKWQVLKDRIGMAQGDYKHYLK